MVKFIKINDRRYRSEYGRITLGVRFDKTPKKEIPKRLISIQNRLSRMMWRKTRKEKRTLANRIKRKYLKSKKRIQG